MTPAEINAAIAEITGKEDNYHGSLDAIVPVVRALRIRELELLFDRLETVSPYPALATSQEWSRAYLKYQGLWK